LFALHVLNGNEDAAQQSGSAAPAKLAATSTSSPAPSGSELAPSASAIAERMATDPEDTLHSIAGLLPRDERNAQHLNALEVRALVEQGRLTEAKSRAHDYFERWPNGPDTAALEQLTGVQPVVRATALAPTR
jgi:hypothetical protein